MVRKKMTGKRLFILDTNVLMHDPNSIFNFDEHDIFIPMTVLEELDNYKKGYSDVARNVRQISRFFDTLLSETSHEEISHGLNIPSHGSDKGAIFFQTDALSLTLPAALPSHKADNSILSTSLALQKKYPEKTITLVSKDINMRIKGNILGIHVEDYFNDRVLDEIKYLHSGIHTLPEDFWETHSKNMESWYEEGRTYYRISRNTTNNTVPEWYPNDCLFSANGGFEAIVRKFDENNAAIIQIIKDYSHTKHAVWGVTARNREQNFALNILMEPEIDFVTIQGAAGCGKTLLSLAAGLEQTLEHKIYNEIIMTRATIPVGEDIGFLPGTEEEKMLPWMGALIDNLEILHNVEQNSEWEHGATQDIVRNRVKIRSLNFMRGRTFANKYIIIDEAQNLTPKQMKTLITRAGPGTKIVCLGDLAQIDTPYIMDTNSGLTYAIDHFKRWEYGAHITLLRGERSRLAHYAAEML